MFRKSLLSLGLLGNGISASVDSFPNWQAAASPLLRESASTERGLFAFVGPLFVSHCGPQVDGLRSKPLAEGRFFSRSTVLSGLNTAIARLGYRKSLLSAHILGALGIRRSGFEPDLAGFVPG